MVLAAQYILEKLDEEQLIEKAWAHKPDRGTAAFDIVIVGHSLGKYTAESRKSIRMDLLKLELDF